ncbi:hypothetical protein IQ07DRAFT_675637 [Pyrenochaeta sp. DS3sAY3a]|nr:hypothetical protein IQ07DRAFT_675637 [Pyrenochaeta sp. DS3sAY3a]
MEDDILTTTDFPVELELGESSEPSRDVLGQNDRSVKVLSINEPSSSSVVESRPLNGSSTTIEANESSATREKGPIGIRGFLEIMTRSRYPLKLLLKSKKLNRPKESTSTRSKSLFSRIAHRVNAFFAEPPAIIEYSATEVLSQFNMQFEAKKISSGNETGGDQGACKMTLIIKHPRNRKNKVTREEIYARHKRVRQIMRESGVTGMVEDLYGAAIREALRKMQREEE